VPTQFALETNFLQSRPTPPVINVAYEIGYSCDRKNILERPAIRNNVIARISSRQNREYTTSRKLPKKRKGDKIASHWGLIPTKFMVECSIERPSLRLSQRSRPLLAKCGIVQVSRELWWKCCVFYPMESKRTLQNI
jgi:hypothetical protein